MSKYSDTSRTKFILKMIENIETIISRHGSITDSLEDDIEAKPAILMSLMQIGETINKMDISLLQKYNLKDDAKGAYNVRNFIAHDYEGVNISLIELLIEDNIPKLKNKFIDILDELNK